MGVKAINTSIKINLLPPADRQACWPVNRLFVAVVLLAVICLTIVTCRNFYAIYRLELDIGEINQQLELLRPTQQMMVSIQLQQQTINAKNSLLTKLTAERKPWHAIVSRLAAIVPPPVWLEELGAGGDKNSVRLKGNALTYPDLTHFLQILEQDELFVAPVLIYAQYDSGLAITKFELTVAIRGW